MYELKEAITTGVPQEEIDINAVEDMINKLDDDGNGLLNFHEFLAATIQIDMDTVTENRRQALFKMFDIEDTGFINKVEIKKAFNKIGRTITTEEINKMFEDFDSDNDAKITREEWRKVVNEIFESTN